MEIISRFPYDTAEESLSCLAEDVRSKLKGS